MTQAQMQSLVKRIFLDIQATRAAGQKEYARNKDNAFANFERIAEQTNIDRKTVLWIYFMKHVDGISSYLEGHKSQREDVRGRITDAIVYLCLLWGMILDESE
tara:strand:- start:1160 stop:1468 length:309 start_codon:yes stop_codon:yes gene_type:complete